MQEASEKNIKRAKQMFDLSQCDLTEKENFLLYILLACYLDLLKNELAKPGQIKNILHRIELENDKPSYIPYRPQSRVKADALKAELIKMLKIKTIRVSKSPVVLIRKADGKWRFCIDFRKLNSITKKDVHPLPRVNDMLNTLQGAKYFSTFDAICGCWQIPMHKSDIEKTAFATRWGLFECAEMPFGLKNAQATFQRQINLILSGLTWQICLCYVYNIIIFSNSF